jgi:hypothetical protein
MIAVDSIVPFNSLALSGGKDVQFEKAIEIIH